MTTSAGPRAPVEADAAPDSGPDLSAPLATSYASWEEAIESAGPGSPFYDREWRGSSLYRCPWGDFHGRSTRSIIVRVKDVHVLPERPERTIEQRAQAAGIVLAKR